MAASGRDTSASGELGRVDARRGLAGLLTAASVLLVALATFATSAGAEVFGQLESWGTPGTGVGQLNNPAPCAVFGVDPVDGSVYAGDSAPGKPGFCRIQKFSAKGAFKGSTTIQFESGGILAHPLRGIAVDHSRERFYLLEDNSSFVGTEVLSYSTVPNGSQELITAGVPLPLPGGTEALKNPESLAVDPADGDIVIIGLDSAGAHVVLLRISDTGAFQARFDEVGNPLHKLSRVAKSVAIGKDGRIYTITGRSEEEGKLATRAWELPADLSELKEVPGFAAAAENEAWPRGLVTKSYSTVSVGNQLSVSPNGDILYFKENGGTLSTTEEPGEVVVRGYSLSEEKTKFIYGGGEYEEGRGACAIGTSYSPIGVTGETVMVFDHANETTESQAAYGPPRVVSFGPKGTGCAPAAHFTMNPAGSATKGDAVVFDAEESDLAGNSLLAYEWDFGDGTIESVESVGGEPVSTTITHRYLAPGDYTAKLKLKLTNPDADPPAAEAAITIVPASPSAVFEPLLGGVFASTVPPGATVEFDAGASSDPAGGPCDPLNGCGPSFEMQSYEWDFGDGGKAGPSPSPIATHAFANPSPSPVERTVTLFVETKEGVKGSTAEVITVKGTPEKGGGGEEPVSEPPPPTTPPPPPPPPPSTGPTMAQKQALARKKCKKLKGKAKAKCMKKANSIGKKKSRSSG